jgi:hypothetical protein
VFDDLAPIALFVYNRLWHTNQVIKSLQHNSLAKNSDLVIFSDSFKNNQDYNSVQELRNYLRTISGFKSVTIIERSHNFGLAKSFIEGISFITDKYKKGIILEDDNLVAPYFLEYINQGLLMYQNDEQVAAITGYMYPCTENLPETFFLQGSEVWGFGIWQRSWKLFESNSIKLLKEIYHRKLAKKFNHDNCYMYTDILEKQSQGLNESWGVRWHASAYLKNMYTLFPKKSLVKNIGFDATGVHCGTENTFDVELFNNLINLEKIPVIESIQAREVVSSFYRKNFVTQSIKAMIYQKIRSSLNIYKKEKM